MVSTEGSSPGFRTEWAQLLSWRRTSCELYCSPGRSISELDFCPTNSCHSYRCCAKYGCRAETCERQLSSHRAARDCILSFPRCSDHDSPETNQSCAFPDTATSGMNGDEVVLYQPPWALVSNACVGLAESGQRREEGPPSSRIKVGLVSYVDPDWFTLHWA
jgi:hypothetical protein